MNEKKGNWWITFTDRSPACAGLVTIVEAARLGGEVGSIDHIFSLPYPATPRLDDNDGWGDGQCPSFCWDPDKCKGQGCCRKNPACTE
jgi:hypothetical protein